MSHKPNNESENNLSFDSLARAQLTAVPTCCVGIGLLVEALKRFGMRIPYYHTIDWGMILLAVLFSGRIYLEYKALKKYIYLLERKKVEEAVEQGREYYSIKRKGFLGLDGQGFNVDDDDAIVKDIATYCGN